MTGRRDLCIMACIFCRDPDFWRWLEVLAAADGKPQWKATEAGAKAFILSRCAVDSRNDLDRDPAAAERFHNLVRKPYLEWKNPGADADGTYDGFAAPGAYQ